MLIDSYDRVIDYLRISVTSRCNFRCLYCMPDTPFEWEPKENILSYEELFLFVKTVIDQGIKKIRISGGEPLVRKDLDSFIRMITEYSSECDIAITTNGYLLEKEAKKLALAGLKRVNISLDTLERDKYAYLAQKDVLPSVLKGIDAALEAGLKVKLNTVVLKGVNEDEVYDLFLYAKRKGCTIRYIEYMENKVADQKLKGVESQDVLEKLGQKISFKALPRTNTPASYYKTNEGYEFGVIEPHKDDFCQNCNRIRLSAEGFLIPCLYFDEALSIKDALKHHDIPKALDVLKTVIKNKPEKNRWSEESSDRAFYETGG